MPAFQQQVESGGLRLRPADAAVAILLHEDGRYIMQLRDAKPDIFYPEHWGCFGGAIDLGENGQAALRRELREELEYDLRSAARFTQIEFDFAPLGHGKVRREYYEVNVTEESFRRFVLHEGADVKAFPGWQLLSEQRVTPYDAFAIWMHLARSHSVGGRP